MRSLVLALLGSITPAAALIAAPPPKLPDYQQRLFGEPTEQARDAGDCENLPPSEYLRLGWAMDLHHNRVAIASTTTVRTYVYDHNTDRWHLFGSILLDDIRDVYDAGLFIGEQRIALHGNMLAISSPYRPAGTTQWEGRVLVYRYDRNEDRWIEYDRLYSTAEFDRDTFGTAVTFGDHGRTLAVVQGQVDAQHESGAVMFYRASGEGLVLHDMIVAPLDEPSPGFGTPIVWDGNQLAIGCDPDHWRHTPDQRPTYIFTRADATANWTMRDTVHAISADARHDDIVPFGDVALRDDTLAISGFTRGSESLVQVFRYVDDAWLLDEEFLTDADIRLGSALSLSDKTLLIGSEGRRDQGRAELWKRHDSGWQQLNELPGYTQDESFGTVLEHNRDHIVISAPYDGYVDRASGRVMFWPMDDAWLDNPAPSRNHGLIPSPIDRSLLPQYTDTEIREVLAETAKARNIFKDNLTAAERDRLRYEFRLLMAELGQRQNPDESQADRAFARFTIAEGKLDWFRWQFMLGGMHADRVLAGYDADLTPLQRRQVDDVIETYDREVRKLKIGARAVPIN
ncbi:MAG: hypothetical protein AAF432_13100 [Planctomycetota bacterium]